MDSFYNAQSVNLKLEGVNWMSMLKMIALKLRFNVSFAVMKMLEEKILIIMLSKLVLRKASNAKDAKKLIKENIRKYMTVLII